YSSYPSVEDGSCSCGLDNYYNFLLNSGLSDPFRLENFSSRWLTIYEWILKRGLAEALGHLAEELSDLIYRLFSFPRLRFHGDLAVFFRVFKEAFALLNNKLLQYGQFGAYCYVRFCC